MHILQSIVLCVVVEKVTQFFRCYIIIGASALDSRHAWADLFVK